MDGDALVYRASGEKACAMTRIQLIDRMLLKEINSSPCLLMLFKKM